ncbi:MAG: glycosyltransferase family 9 protein [Sediminibacterium sp.]
MFNRWKDILYDLVGQIARMSSVSDGANRALVIRLDEIGDYMLWRPALRHLLSAKVLEGKEITLCGNASWRSLYEQLDGECFHSVIWIDKKRFKKDLWYRYQVLKKLNSSGFDVVINPTFSRDKRYDDAMVLAARGKQVYGMVANEENLRRYEKGYDKDIFTHLFRGPEEVMFELLRNRFFAEYVVGSKMNDLVWHLKEEQIPPVSVLLPDKYLVIFPGSRSAQRIWPSGYFAEVARYCQQQFDWEVVLCGGPGDIGYANAFKESFPGNVTDLTGATGLSQLLTILKGAQWLVTVDTGSVHLAAAVGCPVSGIFNGSQYGRFAPYPKELTQTIHAIYPNEIKMDLQNPTIIRNQYTFTVDVPYDWVEPAQVIQTIKPV